MCASLSGMYPTRARISSGDVETSSPSTRIRPAAGCRKPSSALIIVLLPAPLGPSRPTGPAADEALPSRSARLFSEATVTLSRVTTASDSTLSTTRNTEDTGNAEDTERAQDTEDP